MILHAQFLMARLRGDIQHILEPIISIRHLNHVPVRFVIRLPAMPKHFEAECVLVKTTLGLGIVHHKTGVNHPVADGSR